MKYLNKEIDRIKRIWKLIWKSYFIRQSVVIFQVLLLMYLISQAVNKFQMLDNKTTIKDFSNTECKNNNGKEGETNPDCFKVGYDFKRVLFFYNDGLARDLSDNLVELFKENGNVFRIQNEGFPASYAVFSSYITGTPPTNFMGNPIMSDNLIYQLSSNDIPIAYYGTRMPAYDVLEKGKYFEEVKIEYVSKDNSKLYTNLFECGRTPKECSSEFLNNLKSRDLSSFFSGDIIDERNHHTGDKHDKITLEIIKNWINNMKFIKEWVDNNPEYLLVIFSDHGGKLTSETAAHGANNGGNEAFMIIYNSQIEPLPKDKQDKFIDQVDVCSTIWQHFAGSGVSLPAENIGKIQPTTIDKEKIYYTLKLNANQLNRFGKHWNYKLKESSYNEAVEYKDRNVDHSIELFTKYINSLKLPFLNLKKFPTTEVVMFPLTIGLLVCMLLSKQYGSFKNLQFQFRLNFAHVIIPYLIIVGITGLFSGFWVLYWHDDNESIHIFVASLLTTLVMNYSSTATKIEINTNKVNIINGDELQQNKNQQLNNSNNEEEEEVEEEFGNINSNNNDNNNSSSNNNNSNNNNNIEENNNFIEMKSTQNISISIDTTQLNNNHLNNLLNNSAYSPSLSAVSSTTTVSELNDLTQPLASEYRPPNSWVLIYSFYIFFMAVNLFLLTTPLEDLLLVHFYKGSFIIAFIYLMIEFYIQIKRIKAHYAGGDKNQQPKKEYYYSVYLKFIIYTLVMISIYYYDKSWKLQHIIRYELAFFVYSTIFIHSIALLFSSRYYQSDIILPISMLLYYLSNDKERLYLILFVIPQFYCISNIFYFKLFNVFQPILKQYRKAYSTLRTNNLDDRKMKQIFNYSLKDINFFTGVTDHFLPFVVLLMISIALSCFQLMKMNFQIGDVAIYVPGVYDPPTKPVFSGIVMGVHKLGYFFLLGAFLIKLANPCPPALVLKQYDLGKGRIISFGYKSKSNADFNRIVESLNTQVWGFLMLLLLCALFFFHLGYYNFMITKSFVFTVTISVVVVFYGVSLVCSSLGGILQNLFYKHILKRTIIHHSLPNLNSNIDTNNFQYKKINYN